VQGVKHKTLLILLSLTIIGEILSIIIWTKSPSQRFTLAVNWEIAVLNAAAMIPPNLLALVWIIKRKNWGPILLIVISIGNRLLSQPIFIGGMHLIFVTWTALLVIFAYVEYRGLSNLETSFLSGGVIFDIIVSSLLFNPKRGLIFGLVFYFLFLVFLIGALTIVKKLR
jgi:hypothetical protein